MTITELNLLLDSYNCSDIVFIGSDLLQSLSPLPEDTQVSPLLENKPYSQLLLDGRRFFECPLLKDRILFFGEHPLASYPVLTKHLQAIEEVRINAAEGVEMIGFFWERLNKNPMERSAAEIRVWTPPGEGIDTSHWEEYFNTVKPLMQ